MKRHWDLEELIDHFTFMPNELSQLSNKAKETRLGFAVLFKFFQYEARFPNHKNEIPKEVIQYISKQLNLDSLLFEEYNWNSRSIKYHRAQIREYFGFKEASVDDTQSVTDWLSKHVFYHDAEIERLKEEAYRRFRELHIEPPTADRIDRITKSAIFTYENQFFLETFQKLTPDSISKMDYLINDLTTFEETEVDNTPNDNSSLTFSELRADPGRIGLESVFREVTKLNTIKQLGLSDNIFINIPQKILKKYKLRAVSEKLGELRRHPEQVRYTILAVFFWLRSREITDNLIELLIQIIHRIGVRAEKKVDKELLNDFRKVNGKTNLLFQMAEAAINNPDGIVKQVLYPIVSENTLRALIKEYKSTGLAYKQKVYTVMRASYGNHYRRMVPEILNTLEFCSNNDVHRPVIKALGLIKRYTQLATHYFADTEEIPIEGVIKAGMKEAVLEKDDKGQERINRINYEIVTLQALRDKLRCKEIWVAGANRYRNPDEDLPTDFEERREENYKALKQPLDAEEFISSIKQNMLDGLTKLDAGIPKNLKVKFTDRGNGWICITPSDPQPEPINLTKLKAEIMRQWPMTNLLDVLNWTVKSFCRKNDRKITQSGDFMIS